MNQNNQPSIEELLNGKSSSPYQNSNNSSGAGLLILLTVLCLVGSIILSLPIGYAISAFSSEAVIEQAYLDEEEYNFDDYDQEYLQNEIIDLQDSIRLYNIPAIELGKSVLTTDKYGGDFEITIDAIEVDTIKEYGSGPAINVIKVTTTIKNMSDEDEYVYIGSEIEVLDDQGESYDTVYSADIESSADVEPGKSVTLSEYFEIGDNKTVTIAIFGANDIPFAQQTYQVSELKQKNATSI